MSSTYNDGHCGPNPTKQGKIQCNPNTPDEYIKQLKFEYTGVGNKYYMIDPESTPGYCKGSENCISDKNAATEYEILKSGSKYTIKDVGASKFCKLSGYGNQFSCGENTTGDRTYFKLELKSPIADTTSAATPFEDRSEGDLPSGISGYVDALQELSPIVAGESMGKCLGQTQSINSSGGYYCGKLTGDNANDNKNYAKGIYPSQENNYTSNASFRKSVAGHWVAKQNNVDCSAVISYNQNVGATCYQFGDEIVQIKKASKNQFNTVSKAKNCPVLYYKTVAPNQC
jgi:hypothetical protein